MYAYLLFNIADGSFRDEIDAFAREAECLLPRGYGAGEAHVLSPRFLLWVWRKKHDPHGATDKLNPGPTSSPDKGSIFCSGYAAEGVLNGNAPSIFDLVDTAEDTLSLQDSPGGMGSYVWVSPEGDRAVCWSTQPAAVTTFVAKNRDGFCVVGNRPRLVFCASQLSRSYRPRRDYLPGYIASGFAIDGHTPYENTFAIPPNRSAHVENGGYRFRDYVLPAPDPIPQDTPLTEKSQRLAKLLSDACWPIRRIGAGTLFLSGGKDSRAMACALKPHAKSLHAFTFGAPDLGETVLASRVAETVGARYEERRQRRITHPHKAIAASHRATDGLGIAFAHQYDFVFDLGFTEALPSYHGHGHLLRGGFARSMKADREYLSQFIDNAFFAPIASDDAKRAGRAELDDWSRHRSQIFRDRRDVLFYANQDFRLGLFSAPSSLDLTSQTTMIHPLLDERVARFAASLCVFDRVTERVLFGAMQILAPELTRMPLYGEIWRFDRDPDRKEFPDSDHNYQDGFAERQPEFATKLEASARTNGSPFLFDADKDEGFDKAAIVASSILDSSRASDVRNALTKEAWKEVEARAAGKNTAAIKAMEPGQRQNFEMFYSRVFSAVSLYDVHWH